MCMIYQVPECTSETGRVAVLSCVHKQCTHIQRPPRTKAPDGLGLAGTSGFTETCKMGNRTQTVVCVRQTHSLENLHTRMIIHATSITYIHIRVHKQSQKAWDGTCLADWPSVMSLIHQMKAKEYKRATVQKGRLLSHLPLFPREHQHSSDLIFFVEKEREREERMEGWKKIRKESAPSVAPSPPVDGDLQYSCTSMESKSDKEEERKNNFWLGS